MRNVILGIAVLLLGVEIHAQQNIVPNARFEEYCPHLGAGGAEIWHAQPWNNIVNIGGTVPRIHGTQPQTRP